MIAAGEKISWAHGRHVGLALMLTFALSACANEPGQPSPTEEPTETAQPSPSAEPVGQFLFIDADTVLGPENLTEDEIPTKICVQQSRYAHNEQIVWRVKVFDPLTGEPMDDAMLVSVQVVFPEQTLDLHYGPHPRDNPLGYFWTTSWVVPEDYPNGIINYTIEAIAPDGRQGTWEQFEIGYAQLTVLETVRPVIAE